MIRYMDNNRYRRGKDNDTPIVASYGGNNSQEKYCKWCSRLLRKVQDHGENWDWWCSNCNISYPYEDDDLRSRNKIADPERIDNSNNPCISYPPEPSLGKKSVELKGAFKMLRDRGVKFTSYSESSG